MKIKNQGVLPLLVELDRNVSAANTLDITQPDVTSRYTSSEQDIFLMTQTATAFIKTPKSLTLFTRFHFKDTSKPALMSFTFATWSRAKKRSWTLCYFLSRRYRKRKWSPTWIGLCSLELCVLSTANQRKIGISGTLKLSCVDETFVESRALYLFCKKLIIQ